MEHKAEAVPLVGIAVARQDTDETVYGADSDMIDVMIAEACVPGGRRIVTLGRNPDSPDGAWMITRAILLPDDFTLVLDDCRVERAPTTTSPLRAATATDGGQ